MDVPESAGESFIPALSLTEAKDRIFSLTGGTRVTARGEKRAIVALARSLGMDVNVARTNVDLARAVAEQLSIRWKPQYEVKTKVNLAGLNSLLLGAADAKRRGSLRLLEEERPETLAGPEWARFAPAKSKIEAVNRISSLTESGPEFLGPGSKERKSVLVNLARHLASDIDTSQSKTKLGANLAARLGVAWSPTCASTGETISLEGLNVLLAGAERCLGALGTTSAILFPTPREEAAALTQALRDGWRAQTLQDGRRSVVWDAQVCINQMLTDDIRGARDNQWQGFYWEAMGIRILNAAFGKPSVPRRQVYNNTPFDYARNFLWDFKAKTTLQNLNGVIKRKGSDTQLNDAAATELAIADQGLGFLIVSGVGIMDVDREVENWQRSLKMKVPAPTNSGRHTYMKKAFELQSIDAYFFATSLAFEQAKLSGILSVKRQGRQAPKEDGGSGDPRRDKMHMNLRRARNSEFHMAEATW